MKKKYILGIAVLLLACGIGIFLFLTRGSNSADSVDMSPTFAQETTEPTAPPASIEQEEPEVLPEEELPIEEEELPELVVEDSVTVELEDGQAEYSG